MDISKLTKQERVFVIGALILLLGQDLVNERIDKQKIASVLPIFNEI